MLTKEQQAIVDGMLTTSRNNVDNFYAQQGYSNESVIHFTNKRWGKVGGLIARVPVFIFAMVVNYVMFVEILYPAITAIQL